jgi:hypothetical protein
MVVPFGIHLEILLMSEHIESIGDTARISDPNRKSPGPSQPPSRSGENRTTCSLYFSDRRLLDRITEQLRKHPRASFSSMVIQILEQTVEPLEKLETDKHKLELDGIEVWL